MANYSNIFVKEGISYSEYRDLIVSLFKEGKATGDDSSEEMLHYTRLNIQRMERLDKTAVLSDTLIASVNALKNRYHFLVITEGWCGDAAQIVPLFDKMTQAFPDKIDLRFVLRDAHLDLIDAHLTGGARAIPVLLVLNEEGELVARWGPRPAVAQQLLNVWKTEYADKHIRSEKLHLWYAKDKTKTTQQEIETLIGTLEED